jgi:hypothetical protein
MAKQELRYSDAELAMLKTTFAENDELLKLVRKIFLPELKFDAPIGQNIDLWMTIKVEELSPEEALINLKARNSLIQHLEMCLNTIKILSGQKTESIDQVKERLMKDSSK